MMMTGFNSKLNPRNHVSTAAAAKQPMTRLIGLHLPAVLGRIHLLKADQEITILRASQGSRNKRGVCQHTSAAAAYKVARLIVGLPTAFWLAGTRTGQLHDTGQVDARREFEGFRCVCGRVLSDSR